MAKKKTIPKVAPKRYNSVDELIKDSCSAEVQSRYYELRAIQYLYDFCSDFALGDMDDYDIGYNKEQAQKAVDSWHALTDEGAYIPPQ